MGEAATPKHTCHAEGCTRAVPPRLLMCARHWGMVPPALQGEVWRHYRPGQESDGKPITREYADAARAAIRAVAVAEKGAQRGLFDGVV